MSLPLFSSWNTWLSWFKHCDNLCRFSVILSTKMNWFKARLPIYWLQIHSWISSNELSEKEHDGSGIKVEYQTHSWMKSTKLNIKLDELNIATFGLSASGNENVAVQKCIFNSRNFSEPLKAAAESTMIFLERKGTWKNAQLMNLVRSLPIVGTALNDFLMGNHFIKGSKGKNSQNNREIRSPNDDLCDQNELSEDIVVSRRLLVCIHIHIRKVEGHVNVMNQPCVEDSTWPLYLKSFLLFLLSSRSYLPSSSPIFK